MKRILGININIIIITTLLTGGFLAFAQEEGSGQDEIDRLSSEIEDRQQAIDQLNRQIDSYRQKIDEKQTEEAALYVELDILDNRIAKTQLDIESAEAQIDLVNVEIALLEQEMRVLEDTLDRDKEFIAEILREIQVQDSTIPLQMVFSTDSFSEFFDTLAQLESVSVDLTKAVDEARSSKELLLTKHENEQTKKDQLIELTESLEQEDRRLDASIEAKSTLLALTQESEAQFQQLLEDLREEQAYINQQISLLQQDIEAKLDASDILGDSSLLSWPIDPTIRGMTAYFHDPSYPFRHLFEHSGIDLASPTGTPVKVAAPGYVAWTKQGTLYGNYIMVIHTNGLATLYAHLSRIDVFSDQFVSRGDVIGAVGSTGLSTGPHLHFEVRKNGIPSDPLDYLIAF